MSAPALAKADRPKVEQPRARPDTNGWRVFCLRNGKLKELYFGCSDDVQAGVKQLENSSGTVAHWDFKLHDMFCFDLEDYPDQQTAAAAVMQLRRAPPPDGWQTLDGD